MQFYIWGPATRVILQPRIVRYFQSTSKRTAENIPPTPIKTPIGAFRGGLPGDETLIFMANFGVFEVISTKQTAAPGWAYVPDNGPTTPITATQPISRKRARNPVLSIAGGNESKQHAKILRELALLDRENQRDVAIAIPLKHNSNRAIRAGHGKMTPAVRKILQSNKTFTNYLADLEAQITPSSYTSNLTQPATPIGRATSVANLTSGIRRSQKKRDMGTRTMRAARKSSSVPSGNSLELNSESVEENTPISEEMPIFSLGAATLPIPHPSDADPLLVSWIPIMPSQDELRELLDQPPLSYLEARGHLVPEDQRKPPRYFCERCGYWGRIKCVKCGARVCALECYKEHKDECVRYGL